MVKDEFYESKHLSKNYLNESFIEIPDTEEKLEEYLDELKKSDEVEE